MTFSDIISKVKTWLQHVHCTNTTKHTISGSGLENTGA